jgi:hypothetical protein
MPTCELKLVDIPSMSYFADDKPHPRGEMCIRGPGILTTYYKGQWSLSFDTSPHTLFRPQVYCRRSR